MAIFDRDQESLRTKTCNNWMQNQDILFNFVYYIQMPTYLSESLDKINFTYRVKRLEDNLATSRKRSGW